MQNKTIERNSDLRKRVKISIPKLIKEILDKDISYFNIKLEKLCNVIVQEMGYEPLLRIHITFNLTERNTGFLQDMIRNSSEKTESEYFRCLLSTYSNLHPSIRERIIKKNLFLDIERALKENLTVKISYSNMILNTRFILFVRDSQNEYNHIDIDNSELITLCLKDIEILNMSF